METIDEGEEMIPIEPKSKMTNLPMIGLFIRFADTLLHLNNLKFRVITHEKNMLGLEDKQRFDHDYVVALEAPQLRIRDHRGGCRAAPAWSFHA